MRTTRPGRRSCTRQPHFVSRSFGCFTSTPSTASTSPPPARSSSDTRGTSSPRSRVASRSRPSLAMLVAAALWRSPAALPRRERLGEEGRHAPLGSSDVDSVDPALAYTSHRGSLEFATCAKLFNYPDEPGAAGTRDPGGRRRVGPSRRRTDVHVRPEADVPLPHRRAGDGAELRRRVQPGCEPEDEVARRRRTCARSSAPTR